MCLITFQKEIKTESPIKCYKIMNREIINGEIKFFSFFQRFEYSLNELYSLNDSDLIDFEDPIKYSFDTLCVQNEINTNLKYEKKPNTVYEVNHGFHSYENLEYTVALAVTYEKYERYLTYLTNFSKYKCIFECEIPVGAKLYKGADKSYDEWMYDNPELINKSLCYCSDKIKLLRWKSLRGSEWHEAKIDLLNYNYVFNNFSKATKRNKISYQML